MKHPENGRREPSGVRRCGIAAELRCAVVLAALLAFGCGYSVVNERDVFGPDVRVIRLGTLENRTTEIGFEAMMADALQEEFVRRGVLIPRFDSSVPDTGLALDGEIGGAKVTPTAFSSVTLSLEDQIQVSLSIGVRRVSDGEVVLDLPALVYQERFLASADPQVYESNKEQALRRIAARAASQIHDVLFQRF